MKLDQLLEAFGSQAEIADRLGVSRPAVCAWFAVGALPPRRALEIERLTGGALRAVDLVDTTVITDDEQ